MRRGIVFQFVQQTQVQVAPFTHDLFLIITVIPAVQTMLGRILLQFLCRLHCLGSMPRREFALEGIQYGRNMIIELDARQSRCGA